MEFTEEQLSQWLADFLWPLARIAAMLMAAPIFSIRQIPVRFRMLLAVLITVLVQPVLPAAPMVPVFSTDALLILLQQLAIGVALGFLLQMAFNALIFGGQVMAYSMGLGFANMMDPANGVQVPVVSQFWLILAMLAFLLMNGHLVLISAIVDTFVVLPVAADGLGRAGIWELLGWASRMFAAGLVMAMPVIISLLLINIGMGVVSRAAPQLNIFAIGFPITLMTGFILIWITLPQVIGNFGGLVNEAFETLKDPLKRAQYLLTLHGQTRDSQHTLNDPEFLMQQMELREALDEVRSTADAQGRLDGLLREIGGMIQSQVAQLAVQFEESGVEHLAAAAQTVQKMQFLHKLHAETEALEAELEEAL